MASQSERLNGALKAHSKARTATPFMEARLAEGRGWAQSNQVQISSPSQARVVQIDGQICLVNLEAGTCSCLQYQGSGIPCGHAIALILATGG